MLRELGLALGFGALGALGAWPGARGPDPVAACAWIALCALPAGLACGALRLAAWPFAASVPALWMIAVALAGAASERALSTPVWGALAWTGLFAAGWGLARAGVARDARGVAWVLALVVLLAWLPGAGGSFGRPWPPELSARLLDLSPLSLCLESSGLDWMHHPAVYEPAGALDIDPGLRTPYQGVLAGPAVLLVGCALAVLGARRERKGA